MKFKTFLSRLQKKTKTKQHQQQQQEQQQKTLKNPQIM